MAGRPARPPGRCQSLIFPIPVGIKDIEHGCQEHEAENSVEEPHYSVAKNTRVQKAIKTSVCIRSTLFIIPVLSPSCFITVCPATIDQFLYSLAVGYCGIFHSLEL